MLLNPDQDWTLSDKDTFYLIFEKDFDKVPAEHYLC